MLDLSGVVTYTDLFVIMTGRTSRQTQAIADAVQRGLREQGVRPARVEGERVGDWILLDYLDVIVHIFTPEARAFYRLEHLWGDAPRCEVDDDVADGEWVFADDLGVAGPSRAGGG